MNKEIAWLFGFIFAVGCLAFYNPYLAGGIVIVTIGWWIVI